jgi:hypothetical protein
MNAIGFDYFAGGDQFFDADGEGAAAPQAGGVPLNGCHENFSTLHYYTYQTQVLLPYLTSTYLVHTNT